MSAISLFEKRAAKIFFIFLNNCYFVMGNPIDMKF